MQKEKYKRYNYQLEKHITIEWIVIRTGKFSGIKSPIAKCNSEESAIKIKEFYENESK